jgi:hypothetical protein
MNVHLPVASPRQLDNGWDPAARKPEAPPRQLDFTHAVALAKPDPPSGLVVEDLDGGPA